MPFATGNRPLGLSVLAGAYFCCCFLSAVSYRDPYPFLGRFYPGGTGLGLVFLDSIISLYLCIGILKRQRLTVWLIIGYNLLDLGNA